MLFFVICGRIRWILWLRILTGVGLGSDKILVGGKEMAFYVA